ncbi:MAG: hypothetical protein ABII00_06425 [Elusimicrobiota bacterium]
MTGTSIRLLKKLLASVVVGGLILTAPGLPCYRALAQTIGVGAKAAPVRIGGGYAAGSQAASLGGKVSASRLDLALGGGTVLRSALPSAVSPEAARFVRAQAARIALPSAVAAAGRVIPQAAKSAGRSTSRDLPARSAVSARAKSVSAFAKTDAAMEGVRSGRVRAFGALSRLFDLTGKRRAAADSATPVRGSAALAPGSAGRNGGLLKPGAASAARSVRTEPPAQGEAGQPGKERPVRRPPLALVLALGGLGAAGAFFAAPTLLALLGAALPAWFAAHAAVTSGLITSAGGLAGVAASRYDVWIHLPSELLRGAKTAGVSTFRFWARFGRVFNAVLTGGSAEDAMKAPLPLNIFRYPVLAWPFVSVGYGTVPLAVGLGAHFLGWPLIALSTIAPAVLFGGAPAAFVTGFLYKAAAVPARAAFLGLKQIVLEFFPWLADFFSFLNRFVRNFLSFAGGFVVGVARTGGAGIALGSVTLGRPVFNLVVAPGYRDYGTKTLPALIGMRLLQFVGLVGTAAAGVVGGALGLVLSLPFIPMIATYAGLEVAELHGGLFKLLEAWFDSVEKEEQIGELSEYGFASYRDKYKSVRLGEGVIRMLNIPVQTGYLAAALTASAAVMYARAWVRAIRSLQGGKEDGSARSGDKAAGESEEPVKKAARPAAATQSRPMPTLILGGLGSSVGGAVAFHFFLGSTALLSWPALGILGAGTLIGGSMGLALSQPGAWKGFFAAVAREAKRAAGASFRSWARLALNADAAIRAKAKDAEMFRAPPARLSRYPWLARPAVVIGYGAAAIAYPVGVVYRALAVPVQASWQGFMVLADQILPFLRRVAEVIGKVARRIVPFVLGLAWGIVKGVYFSAMTGATVFATPMLARVVSLEWGDYRADTVLDMFAVKIVQAVAAVLGLAIALVGLVAGAVYGLPYTATLALSAAFRWAHVGGRLENFFQIWEPGTMRQEKDRIEELSDIDFPTQGKKITYWQGIVRAGNFLAHSIGLIVSFKLIVGVTYARSVFRAARYAMQRDPDKNASLVAKELTQRLKDVPGFISVEGTKYWGGSLKIRFKTAAELEKVFEAGLVARLMEGYPVDLVSDDGGRYKPDATAASSRRAAAQPADESQPAPPRASKGGAVAAFILGLLGTGGGAYAAYAYAIPLLGLTGWAAGAGYALSALIGGGAGLAVSQPSAWRGYHRVIAGTARESGRASHGFWKHSGEIFVRVLTAGEASGNSFLAWPYKAAGAILALVAGLAGALHGVAVVPVRASLLGAKKVLESLFPWFKKFMRVLWRVARRFFPFVFGGVAGLAAGVLGSALFGALLLGRPWFKHVVAESFDTRGLVAFLNSVVLRLVAGIAGVAFGTAGLAFGALAALPYALTLSPALAFRFSEVGGKAQRLFDLWSKGNLLAEMRRINLLTNRFEFNEERTGGRLALGDGWIRMAIIFPAVLAAALAATIAGYVSYVRSIVNAVRDLLAGKDVPDDPGGDGQVVGRMAGRFARTGSQWLGHLAGWGGVLYGAYLVIRGFMAGGGVLSAVWKGLLYAVLSWPAGGLTGAILGAVAGVTVGLMIWMARQLEDKPSK